MKGIMSLFRKPINKVLGDPVKREIKRYQGVVDLINELEPEMSALTDEELRDKTREFRERLGVEGADITHGQSFAAGLSEETEEMAMQRAEEEEREAARRQALDDLLPEAFAVVREASKRTLGMRHFDVQLIGGMVLHQGRIAEMKTGEGKTLVATLALYLNALEGRGAHLVTVNDYLARRDAGWNAALYHFLGLTVGVIAGQDMSYVYDPEFVDDTHPDPRLQHLRPCTRREAYAADITYSTNNELGFDYLRDNMAQKLDRCVQRRLHYAIVDEVDSILIDEARTPLIISGQASEATDKFYTYARLIPRLVAEDDYTIDEKTKSATLTEEGVDKIEKWTGISNVYDMEHAAEAHQINQALRAHALWLRDSDYIVRDGEVIIVDEFTGRTMPGRRWSDGLHQAIEAKEGVGVQQETVTLATITFQNFFRLYDKLAGHDRYGAHRGRGVPQDLQARGGADPDAPADGASRRARPHLQGRGRQVPRGGRGDRRSVHEGAADPGRHDEHREERADEPHARQARRPALRAQCEVARERGGRHRQRRASGAA